MVHQVSKYCVVLMVTTMVWSVAISDFTNVINNVLLPSSSCCSQLGTIVWSQPQFLCPVLSDGSSNFGLNINETTCNVQTRPLNNADSSCSSPGSTLINSPNTKSGPGAESKTILLSVDGTDTDATPSVLIIPVLCFLMFITSYVSTLV